ncbi:hypothetical protein DFH07DRAFT_775940 [Mycena maculata]|uniref:Uncharacterized protein n=1 Tax=Mycena maculata TaxID=230809 RepID=A0AAD7N6M1_9AGAR|nr:hypothetical protein DFH07DRAFT_775940 [Mycena maculata]
MCEMGIPIDWVVVGTPIQWACPQWPTYVQLHVECKKMYDTRWPLSVQMGSMYGTFRMQYGVYDQPPGLEEEGLGPARAAKRALRRPQNSKNELGQKEWACPPSRDVTHGYTHGGYTHGGHAHDKWVYPQGGSYPPWEGLLGHNSIWTDEAYWGLG